MESVKTYDVQSLQVSRTTSTTLAPAKLLLSSKKGLTFPVMMSSSNADTDFGVSEAAAGTIAGCPPDDCAGA